MKVFPSRNGPRDPKQAKGDDSGKLALSPQESICTPPLLGHNPMVTSLLDQSEVIILPMKDGDGKQTFKLGPIVIMPCHPWDSNAKVKQNPPSPLQKDSPVQCLPCEHPRGNPLQARVAPNEPSQHNEPPLPGPNPSSKPPEDVATRKPTPEVAPTQSMEEPFACPTTPRLIIIIGNTPVGSPPPISPAPTPPPSTPTPVPSRDLPPIAAKNPTAPSPLVPSSSHSYNEACQEFTNLRPTLMIPQAINQVLLEHHRLCEP
ncbi:hypothetical protein O181_114602 [Austropuccinia psidii MF-1]|uniref:Uncharacterized protein n=1 Tax=Austropuccinia psidii MF-1 TaxID=1389203 RepID=A0A9Q3K5W5_9BASI|nr:hypothetical protein [Austropuccinia psidii MF-1]